LNLSTLTILSMILAIPALVTPAWAGIDCPPGSRLSGAEPPDGNSRGCQKIDKDGNPVKHGPWTEWYMNGAKQAEGQYVDGRQHGSWQWWYPNGRKKQEGRYLDGRPVGRWVYWDEQGREKPKKKEAGGKGAQMSDFADSLGGALKK
jgi:antitoxin component YwqK of YwqJK toxin-antitoxin module